MNRPTGRPAADARPANAPLADASPADAPTADAVPGFADRLRAVTRGAHRRAEQDGALERLLQGTADIQLYRALLEQLWFVYEALEQVGDTLIGDPVVAKFLDEDLRRAPALRADLHALCGPRWRSGVVPLPETAVYVTRLHQVASRSAAAYVAHHYTRYLGDLSGGLAVGDAVRRHLGLTARDGAAFFTFAAVDDPDAYRQRYRHRLDAAPWDERQRETVLAEVLMAYQLNGDQQRALVSGR